MENYIKTRDIALFTVPVIFVDIKDVVKTELATNGVRFKFKEYRHPSFFEETVVMARIPKKDFNIFEEIMGTVHDKIALVADLDTYNKVCAYILSEQ